LDVGYAPVLVFDPMEKRVERVAHPRSCGIVLLLVASSLHRIGRG
jgi:hypothetical protein